MFKGKVGNLPKKGSGKGEKRVCWLPRETGAKNKPEKKSPKKKFFEKKKGGNANIKKNKKAGERGIKIERGEYVSETKPR